MAASFLSNCSQHLASNDMHCYPALAYHGVIYGLWYRFYAYNATVRSMTWVVPRAAFITVLLPAVYYGFNLATNWRHEFRADKVAADQGFALGGVERLKRKEQIDGLKAEVLSLRSATAVDAKQKFKDAGGAKSPGMLQSVYALSTHPPSDWRIEALQKKMTGMRAAIYSIITLGA